VPPIPNSIQDVVGAYVFNQLHKRCNHCNKEYFTAEDEQRRKDWVFTKFPPGGSVSSDGQAQHSGKDHGGGGHCHDSCGSKKDYHCNRDHHGC